MKDIQSKIEKYKKPYVPGEKRNSAYERELREKQTLKRRKQIAKSMKYEAKYLIITNHHMQQVEHLITVFNDKFQELHRRVSEETIILAFLFYTVRLDDSRININNYRISKKYGLNDQVYSLIISRMLHYYMSKEPITPIETTEYNHELLYENHGKI